MFLKINNFLSCSIIIPKKLMKNSLRKSKKRMKEKISHKLKLETQKTPIQIWITKQNKEKKGLLF
jgi:hypothetical protein